MVQDPRCVFCKIVTGKLPAWTVWKSDAALAFLDIGPLAAGHLLLIPRDHYVGLTDLPADTCAQIASAIPRLGKALMEVTGAAGLNLLCNHGEIAGQVVPHVHFHLIPRRSGDGLGYRWLAGKYEKGRVEQLAADYVKALS